MELLVLIGDYFTLFLGALKPFEKMIRATKMGDQDLRYEMFLEDDTDEKAANGVLRNLSCSVRKTFYFASPETVVVPVKLL